MSTTATGEQFLDAVRRSGLLTDPLLAPFRKIPDPRAVASQLIREGLLTPYQARQLLAGKPRGFFLAEKYKVLGLIGTGGMGHVYLCEHLVLRRLVAVKMLQLASARSSTGGAEGAVERFVREARAVAALDHPNIVRVHDMERNGALPFMVMEYVDGASLHQIVADGGMLSVARAVRCITQAAAGLQHAHEHGLIHRDIKPGNLLLDRGGTVKLLDLGLARFKDAARNDNLTARFNEDSAVVGTADFMSPEQAFNSPDLDIRSDLYSLGATFHFLLTGQAPFEGESLAQKLIAHQFREPKALDAFRADVPPRLAEVLFKLMSKSPEDRHRDPAALIEDLKPWSSLPVDPPTAQEMPRMPPSAYRLGLAPVPERRDAAVWEMSSDAPTSDLSLAMSDSTAPPHVEEPTAPVPSELKRLVLKKPSKPMSRRTWLAIGGGTSAVLAGGGGLWRVFRKPREDGPPNPVPPPSPAGLVVTGSGSTFVQPAIAHWAPRFEKAGGAKIKYDGIGSGRGVENMIDRVLDFGCTDAPMTDAELAKAMKRHGEVLHIPLALGAVVATVNLPGLSGLKLTGSVLADIYLGKIKNWNESSIGASNPGTTLPDLPIHVLARSDSSGTTYVWTEYLKKSSGEWAGRIGASKLPKWPVGEALDFNDGIADAVSRKVGAIGYVELSFALERNLRVIAIKNGKGRYIDPSLDSVTAAANAALRTIPPDLRFSLTDAPGDEAYPVAACSWAVLYADQTRANGAELVKFLQWAVHDGQTHLKDLRYAPLPENLVQLVDAKLASVRMK